MDAQLPKNQTTDFTFFGFDENLIISKVVDFVAWEDAFSRFKSILKYEEKELRISCLMQKDILNLT